MALEIERKIPDKQYFKIGEVCEITGVKQHVLRYWETEFPHLKPQRIGSRQRLYRRADIESILAIKKLLKDEGFSISGARKHLGRGRRAAEPVGGPVEQESRTESALLAEIKRELLAIAKIVGG